MQGNETILARVHGLLIIEWVVFFLLFVINVNYHSANALVVLRVFVKGGFSFSINNSQG